jgi:hypothetical protein
MFAWGTSAWDYPKSKVRTEQLIRSGRGDMPAVLLRIAGVYTDGCQSIPLAHQIQRIYERRLTSKVFPGDTSTGQSFVHLDDVVEAFRATVARRAQLPAEAVILVGEPEPLSYDDLQRALAELIHGEREWDTMQIPKAVAKAGAWVQDQIPGVEEPFVKPWMIDLADDRAAPEYSDGDLDRRRTVAALRSDRSVACDGCDRRWSSRRGQHPSRAHRRAVRRLESVSDLIPTGASRPVPRSEPVPSKMRTAISCQRTQRRRHVGGTVFAHQSNARGRRQGPRAAGCL